jgi:hypothetical protein
MNASSEEIETEACGNWCARKLVSSFVGYSPNEKAAPRGRFTLESGAGGRSALDHIFFRKDVLLMYL